jgi:asparaginyl-tRNA synthetase
MQSMKDAFSPIGLILEGKVEPGPVTVAGWIRTRREAKRFSFLELNDGSSARGIQVVADAVLPNYAAEIVKLTSGASVRVQGELVASKGTGQKLEIVAKEVEVYGYADPEEYPLQKKEMSYEYLREQAHLRARTALFGSLFRIRSRVSTFVHDFFEENGFFYAHTPIFTASDCEGGGNVFQVTTLNIDKPPRDKTGKLDYGEDFFGKKCFLTVSGQLEGELMALGMGKIYTFGPTFRAENSNTSRHLAEFWQIEPEMAFWNLCDTIQLGQDLVTYCVRRFLAECKDDLELVIARNGVDPRPWLQMTLERPFVRVSYTEAVDILKGCGETFDYPVEWGIDLQSEHERYLCEKHFKAPTVVYDYPAALKAFYMYLNEGGKTVHGADILVPGVGEIIGSSQREHRYDVLKARVEEKGLKEDDYDWYMATRKFGTVPHSGFGMGLERLLMWMTGMGNIRDVIPFPRTPKTCLY